MKHTAANLGDSVFLSPEMVSVEREFRRAYPELFNLAERLNEIANQKMFATEVQSEDLQQILLACLLHRALTTFQAVIALSARGMPSESRVLLRTLVEVTFRLVAIAKDPDVGRAYAVEDELHRKKFLNKFKLLSASVKEAVGTSSLDHLLPEIQKSIDLHGARKLDTQWFAERAGLADFYHSAYSHFSSAVHVTARNLEIALDVDEAGNISAFNYGPNDSALEATVLTSIESLIFCIRAAFSVLSDASPNQIDKLNREFVELHERIWKRQQSEA